MLGKKEILLVSDASVLQLRKIVKPTKQYNGFIIDGSIYKMVV